MNLLNIFTQSLKESFTIVLIILILMIFIEFIVLKYQNKIINIIKKNKIIGYIISSFFGIIPGCIGTFIMDSLYMTGLLGFGGIVSVMIATSGDEAFILLSMAFKGDISWNIIIILTSVLFFLGIIGGFIASYLKKKTKMKFCVRCKIENHKVEEFKLKHFFKEHIINHIIKKHIWQIFLWIFAAIFIIKLLQDYIILDFTGSTLFFILLIASLVALLPISGPNIFLVIMFSQGLIPFSILLANSIIQDGHGLLPILGFSIDDAVKIKLFNFFFGFLIGGLLLFIGL